MSLEMQVYAPSADDSLTPRWVQRLNSLGMRCEIHPTFSFETHSGFLPFKVEIENPRHEELLGKSFLTGFEFYMQDFDLAREMDAIRPKPRLLDRLTGKRADPLFFASPEIDARLANCHKVISCVWGSADTLELRMATVSAAILADLTGGIFAYPADNVWYTESGEIEKAITEAEAYEASVRPSQLRLHEFEKWL